jgi:hypothetical protein
MKLKEKLARNYLNLNNDGPEFWAYLAGFEKAREMIADQFKVLPDIRKDILTIGEEEVNN